MAKLCFELLINIAENMLKTRDKALLKQKTNKS